MYVCLDCVFLYYSYVGCAYAGTPIFSGMPIRDKTRPMFSIHDIFDSLSLVFVLELEA